MKEQINNSQKTCQNIQYELEQIKRLLNSEEEITTVNQAVYLALKKEYGSIGVLASKMGVTPQYLNLYFNADKTRSQVIEPALEVLLEYKKVKAQYEILSVQRLRAILIEGAMSTATDRI